MIVLVDEVVSQDETTITSNAADSTGVENIRAVQLSTNWRRTVSGILRVTIEATESVSVDYVAIIVGPSTGTLNVTAQTSATTGGSYVSAGSATALAKPLTYLSFASRNARRIRLSFSGSGNQVLDLQRVMAGMTVTVTQTDIATTIDKVRTDRQEFSLSGQFYGDPGIVRREQGYSIPATMPGSEKRALEAVLDKVGRFAPFVVSRFSAPAQWITEAPIYGVMVEDESYTHHGSDIWSASIAMREVF